MTIDRLKELDQNALFTDINKSVDEVGGFLYVVLDEPVRFKLADTLERLAERLRNNPSEVKPA